MDSRLRGNDVGEQRESSGWAGANPVSLS